jgi:HNH endonuclease
MPTPSLCPYCRKRVADDKDHIFPDFFGGKAYVLACKDCNNRFGHQFEGKSFNQLKSLFVMLGICGLSLPKPFKWKNAVVDPHTGWSYDLGADLVASLSKTTPEFDEVGTPVRFHTPNIYTARKLERQLMGSGKFKGRIKHSVIRKVDYETRRFIATYSLNSDFRRLVLKMCVAFCRRMNVDEHLIGDSVLSSLPGNRELIHEVRIDYNHYPALDSAVPPLAHSIYVEASPRENRAYALVRLFGTIQFFTTLQREYRGPHFSGIGFLNPVDYSETFDNINPLQISEPPQHVLKFLADYKTRNSMRRLDEKVKKTFGQNRVFFGPTEAQMILLMV